MSVLDGYLAAYNPTCPAKLTPTLKNQVFRKSKGSCETFSREKSVEINQRTKNAGATQS